MENRMKRIIGCWFSPCGNVKTAVEKIVGEIGKSMDVSIEFIDFTPKDKRETNYLFDDEDLVVIGCPVYAGRVPNKIMPFFKDRIKGNGSKCISVVSYGNRSFDNALAELSGLMSDNGMKVIAGAAVVGEHSFANTLATNRPDENDIAEYTAFAEKVALKIKAGDESTPNIVGNYPCDKYYTPLKENGEPAVFLKAIPQIDITKCKSCGKCSSVCPMNSISGEAPFQTTSTCIKCQACIKACPEGARFFDNEDFLSHKRMLERNYAEVRKANEFFVR